MTMRTGLRTLIVGIFTTIAVGIPEARAQQARRAAPCAGAPGKPAQGCAPARTRRDEEGERRLRLSLARDLWAARPQIAALPYPLLYGIELEPAAQLQRKREILFLLSDLTGASFLRHAAASLSPSSSIRAVVDAEIQDRMRLRATFVETEELQGPSPPPVSPRLQAAFASSGALLFASGILGGKLISAQGKDATVIAPQPLPTGIRISGTFNLP